MTDDPHGLEDIAAFAHTLDVTTAFAKALDRKVGHSRREDPYKVQEYALQYATQTMIQSIGDLALIERARTYGSPTRSASGYKLCALPDTNAHTLNFLMAHDTRPGGWLITVEFAPVLHAEGEAHMAELKAQRRAEAQALGLTDRDLLFAEMGIGKTKLQSNATIEVYHESGAGYRPAQPGDVVKLVQSTALDLGAPKPLHGATWSFQSAGGLPGILESSDAVRYTPDLLAQTRDIWWSGIDFDIQPAIAGAKDDMVLPRSSRTGPDFATSMGALSDLLRDHGFAEAVGARNATFGAAKWHAAGVGHFGALQEAGFAAIFHSGGFFDAAAAVPMQAFSADIAAKDVGANVDDWVRAARGLIAHKYTHEQATFDCNDLRDVAFARATPEGVVLRTATQHGTYYVHITLDAEDRVLAVRATRNNRHDVGRFVQTPQGLRGDFGATPDRPAIAHTMHNIYDMNTIIASLSSVACVFEDEMRTVG